MIRKITPLPAGNQKMRLEGLVLSKQEPTGRFLLHHNDNTGLCVNLKYQGPHNTPHVGGRHCFWISSSGFLYVENSIIDHHRRHFQRWKHSYMLCHNLLFFLFCLCSCVSSTINIVLREFLAKESGRLPSPFQAPDGYFG